MAHHTPLGLQAGLTQAHINTVLGGRTPGDLDAANHDLCDYVCSFLAGQGIAPELAAVLSQHSSTRQIADISLLAGYYLPFGTMLLVFGVEPPDILTIELEWQRKQNLGG
jgi:hypothetical protein